MRDWYWVGEEEENIDDGDEQTGFEVKELNRTEPTTTSMTGKRPRALTRTASVSQLSSGSLSQQEFSPLLENPKEKLKPTVKDSAGSSPRVVIGFDPKPSSTTTHNNPASSPKSAPCSPSFHDKASSPRSVLNSLFSRQRGGVTTTTTEGVGLGIVLHTPSHTLAPEVSIPTDHIAIPVHEIPQWQQIPTRRHSHPIPTPGISPCHSSHQQCVVVAEHKPCESSRKGSQAVQRPILGWLEQDVLKVDRRDTFLLAASPARSLMGDNVAAALTASSHFLDECSFCKRHLPKDKDIFMYRYAQSFTFCLHVRVGKYDAWLEVSLR